MEYMILDLICLVVSFETVYYTPKTDIYSSSYGFRNINEIWWDRQVGQVLVPLPVVHKLTAFMEYMILDLICLVVSFKTVYYTPKTEPVSLNFIYVSKAITWAIYVRFRRIIYRFEAYDETNQIQNHVLHKIHGFMRDKQWNRCHGFVNLKKWHGFVNLMKVMRVM